MSGALGFTFVEVLVALAIAAVVGGSAYLLLDAGLDLHVTGTTASTSATGFADVAVWLRADLARADMVTHLSADSLQLALPDGSSIAWASRSRPGGKSVVRFVDRGSGPVQSPMRALAEFSDGPTVSAALRFVPAPQGMVRAHLISDERNVTVQAAAWSRP